MQIFNPILVGPTTHKETANAPSAPSAPHEHVNLNVLNRITVDVHGVLLFDGKPVDTVGQEFVNAAILEQFAVVDNKLYFAGSPVDTVGSVFSNDAVLRMFSQSAEGKLLFNGQPIEGGGSNLPNADDLARLAIDENGQLTVDGIVVSGSGGAVTLSVTKLGAGTALIKSVVGTDIQTRSLVAGANVTLDVSGDEVKINASLNGSVSASSTFKSSDGYSITANVVSDSTATALKVSELSVDANTKLLLPLVSSLSEAVSSALATPSGTASIQNQASMRGGKALYLGGGSSYVQLTAAQQTAAKSAICGTGDFTIEFEMLAGPQTGSAQIFGCYAGGGVSSNDSFSVMASATGLYTYSVSGTSSLPSTNYTGAVDSQKHHVAVVRSSGTLYLYVDGVLKHSVAYTGSINSNSTAWRIGNSAGGNNGFSGYLRNLAVYNYAKYTAAFTPLAFYSEAKAATNVLNMTGKLLSSQFWKQVSSLSVVSTETATAYLKWLMVDATGYNVWDSANKVWVAADIANIASVGMTTTEVKAAFLNNPWNYRSDTVGFAVALVTTDGASSPVLTSATLAAVQSADKTAGHAVLDGSGVALPQRTSLKFEDLVVSDDGTHTVVKGSAAEVAALQGQVTSLQQQSGKVGGYAVDVSSPQNGSVLAYDSAKNAFVAALPAVGASGNGLHMTDVVTLAAGAEALVTHQQVLQGRAVYQAEEFIAAGSASSKRDTGFNAGLVSAAPIGSQSLRAQRPGFRLPFQYTSIAKLAAKTMPAAVAYAEVFQVDDNVYLFGGRTSATTATTAVMKATHGSPSTVTKGSETVGAPYTDTYSGTNILRVGDYLYRVCEQTYSGATASTSPAVSRAHISDPLTWTQIGVVSTPIYWAARFIIGDYLYYVGGLTGSTVLSSVYRSKLTDLCAVEYVGTFAGGFLYAATFYQYGDYLYIIGGRGGSSASTSTVLGNKIWRAHISDPLTWTQIGTFPMVAAYSGCAVVGDRVVIGGVRTGSDGTNVSTAVYVSNAADPTSWSATTALSSALIARSMHCVDDMVLFYGGATFSLTCSTLVESYQLTFTNTADRAVVYTADYSLDPVQSITSLELDANLPAGTSIRTLVSFDKGVTWCYWNGSVWVESLLNDEAFDSTLDAVASGSRFTVPGIAGTFDKETVRFAFQLKSTVATLTPRLYSVNLNYVEAGSMMPLSVGGFNSAMAEIGVKHRQGSYQATSVKNLTNRSLSLVLKVYDGAI